MPDVNEANQHSFSRWKHDIFVALGAGLGAGVIVALGTWAVGYASPGETRLIVDAILPSSRFLCSSVMTATATILALMLTLLGMTVNTERQVSATFYKRVQQIAFYDMLLLVAATVFLVMHCVPITESDEVPDWWYPAVYYFLLASSAMIAGAMVSVVAMLYHAVRDMIDAMGVDGEGRIFVDDDGDE